MHDEGNDPPLMQPLADAGNATRKYTNDQYLSNLLIA